ncbi:putative atp synthase subunit g protein [Phaeoacremonium minimum UCRPA7]|uniref:Putative atp synthase subunit g protein n=1 Tax=Phaeoacremonium minimum (strain UCR-PA7) TaxID=1286976 RepID=R8BGT4_PHAM7|nr:putative atp synthase subunit g protein [Phaeoacremonium minimum UCRPA7]EON98555.1 putative atp synthase subunit g protein [Phaeoacremonium minimum UCRPA7]
MSLSASARPLMRRSAFRQLTSRTAGRRFESTTTKASEAAKDAASKTSQTASDYTTKAAQGLSRVTSAAGPAIAGVAKGAAGALGRVGGRTGKLISFVERQVPLVAYYGKVGIELSKIVFQGQKMTPPSISTFQAYFQRAVKGIQNPSSLLQSAQGAAAQSGNLVQRARNLSTAQLVGGGVLLAECLGFFTVGEMIGRFKLIGYHGEGPAAHH